MEWLASFWEAKEDRNDFPLNLAELAPVLQGVRDGLTLGSAAFPHTNAQADALVKYIHQTGAALAHSEDLHGDLFDFFLANEGIELLVTGLLAYETLERVRVQLFQTLCLLLTNARPATGHRILEGGAYNKLLRGQPELPTDDSLAFYVHIVKHLAMRVTAETAERLLMPAALEVADAEDQATVLPVLKEAARFIMHPENLASTSARVACLRILQVKDPRVRAAAVEVLEDDLLPRLVDALRSIWAAVAAAAREQDASAFKSATNSEEDILEFVAELLGLGLPWVTQAIADQIFAGLLLPQLLILAVRHQEEVQPQYVRPCMADSPKPPPVLPVPSLLHLYQDFVSPWASPKASPVHHGQEEMPEEEDVPDDLDEALALRSIGACLQQMRLDKTVGIMVPIIQLLLWPVVPAVLAQRKALGTAAWREVCHSFANLSAGHSLEDLALKTSEAASPATERQKCWQLALRGSEGLELPGQVFAAPNPFLRALKAMLGGDISTSIGATGGEVCPQFGEAVDGSPPCSLVPSAGMASWILQECRASLYPTLLEDARLLPPSEAVLQAPKAAPQSWPQVDEVPSPLPTEKQGGSVSSFFHSIRSLLWDAKCL